jgi:hypothetical protein
VRLVNLRAGTQCVRCRRRLYAGDCVAWDAAARQARCEVCAPYRAAGGDAKMEACLVPPRSTTSAPSR